MNPFLGPLTCRTGRAFVVAAGWLIFSQAAWSADLPKWAPQITAEQRQLLEEYRVNYDRLTQTYNNAKIETVCQKELSPGMPGGRASRTETRLVFRANGGKFLRMDRSPSSAQGGPSTEPSSVEVVRPEGFVMATRGPADEPFVVKDWGPNVERGLRGIGKDVFQWSPYSRGATPLKWFILADPPNRWGMIEEVLPHVEAGERLVTVTVASPAPEPDQTVRVRFVFYRDRAWALKQYTWGNGDLPKSIDLFAEHAPSRLFVEQARYEYEGEVDAVPLLKAVEYRREEGASISRVQYRTVAFVPGAVPEEEFTPAALGLPIGRTRSGWITGSAVLLSGVFLLGMWFVLRRWSPPAYREA